MEASVSGANASEVFGLEEDTEHRSTQGRNARKGVGGAKRKAEVWEHFLWDSTKEKSVCQVKLGDRICGAALSGKNPTNLENHLKYKHPSLLNQLERAKQQRIQANSNACQLTLPASIQRIGQMNEDKYGRDHPTEKNSYTR